MKIDMNNILKVKLDELKIFQDQFLRDKEKAYKNREISIGLTRDDSDDAELDRHLSYRRGYENGWHEALEEKKRIENNFILNETEALIILLNNNEVIDEYKCRYSFNKKHNNIFIKFTDNSERFVSIEEFLDCGDIKFKKHTEHVIKHKYEQNISDIQMNKVFLIPFISDCLDKILKNIDENKTYKFGIIIEEVF